MQKEERWDQETTKERLGKTQAKGSLFIYVQVK